MKKLNIYEYLDYQVYLNKLVNLPDNGRGYRAKISEAIGIQKSYLSRVLSSSVHLTQDHVFKLAKFLKLSQDESDYLMQMLNFAKAGDHEYRQHLKSVLQRKQNENANLDKRIEKKQLAKIISYEHLYYSHWVYPAIHMLLTIKSFQTGEAIAKHLQLPQEQVEIYLQQLAEIDLAKYEDERWKTTSHNIHLPKHSPYRRISHQNWRFKALEKMGRIEGEESGVHYSSLYTLSTEDIETLKDLIKNFIEDTRQIVMTSQEQELVCLNLDFFKV